MLAWVYLKTEKIRLGIFQRKRLGDFVALKFLKQIASYHVCQTLPGEAVLYQTLASE